MTSCLPCTNYVVEALSPGRLFKERNKSCSLLNIGESMIKPAAFFALLLHGRNFKQELAHQFLLIPHVTFPTWKIGSFLHFATFLIKSTLKLRLTRPTLDPPQQEKDVYLMDYTTTSHIFTNNARMRITCLSPRWFRAKDNKIVIISL